MKKLFRFALLFASAAVMAACSGSDDEETPGPGPGTDPTPDTDKKELTVMLSSSVIKADGVDKAVITVKYGNEDVTSESEFYVGEEKTPTTKIVNATYSTTTPGEFNFWVAYGRHNTKATPTKIMAIANDIPDRATDSKPSSTSFKKEVLVMEFTGLGCEYCPYMLAAMHKVLADAEYSAKMNLAMLYTLSSGEPFYPGPVDEGFGADGAPYVQVDARTSFANEQPLGVQTNVTNIKSTVDLCHAIAPQAGIAVNMVVGSGQMVARATVKAAKTAKYRIGAWILEDGLTSKINQTNDYNVPGDFSVHNNVVRLADSKVSTYDYSGYDLGTIAAGEYADHAFTINLDSSWKVENCHVIFFVMTEREDDARYLCVTNSIDVPLKKQEVGFAYK